MTKKGIEKHEFQKDVKSIRLRPQFVRELLEVKFQKDVKSIRLRPWWN